MGSATDALRAETDGLRRALELAQHAHELELAKLDQRRKLAEEHEHAAAVLTNECERLRAEVASLRETNQSSDLKRRLEGAERVNRELSEILGGMGITYQHIFDDNEAIG
jgi:hypothetical protein